MALSSIFIACQKDKAPVVNASGATEVYVTPRIKSFVQRSSSSRATKDAATISLDSAEWYIEAGLNYTLGEAWKNGNDRVLDSMEVSIPMGSGGVLEQDAHSAYGALHAAVAAKLVDGENHLVMADVRLVPTSSTEAVAKVLVALGSGYGKAGPNTTYGPNEFIYYSFMGMPNNNCGCGSNQGGATTCSDIRIAQRVYATSPPINYGCYFVEVESRGVDWDWNATNMTMNYSYTNFPTGIPATPYKIFGCQGSGCECLSPSKMSFYTQGAYDIMMQIKPANKTLAGCTLSGRGLLTGPIDSEYWHVALFTYGKLTCPRH